MDLGTDISMVPSIWARILAWTSSQTTAWLHQPGHRPPHRPRHQPRHRPWHCSIDPGTDLRMDPSTDLGIGASRPEGTSEWTPALTSTRLHRPQHGPRNEPCQSCINASTTSARALALTLNLARFHRHWHGPRNGPCQSCINAITTLASTPALILAWFHQPRHRPQYKPQHKLRDRP